MQILRCKTGPLDFEVQAGDPDIISIVKHALPSSGSAKDVPKATITIYNSPSWSQITEGAHAPDGLVFKLKHVTYIYYPNDDTYWIYVGDRARGLIDLKKSTTVWNVRHPIRPLRSAFHILMLDPLSLLLPPYGLLICHGAAVVSKQEATLLFGGSKSGKSSLGFLASHMNPSNGIRILSDDTLILDFTTNVAQVYPVNTGFGLTYDLLKSLNVQEQDILQYGQGKAYLSQVPHQTQGAYRINRIILLENQTEGPPETQVSKLNYERTLRAVLDNQTTIGSPYLIQRLNLFRRLVGQASGISLRYSTYCDLNVLLKMITED